MSEEDDLAYDELPCAECGAEIDEEHEPDCPNRNEDEDDEL